eukprot:CAMPEP_0114526544 /NCGR_PEP_ID=MMETSP0109-20121206/23084_1 /TAXON_ID=29199 /ORGANISM="Chlorarachnion reptans, Strain CCCM449" /LENGTH=1519 /DNA_ID=CAMNT_0001708339 /DNA_START=90 /DNA_END=4646 /DNA_ORIENTATION=-
MSDVLHLSRLNLGLGKRVQPLCIGCSKFLLAVGGSTGSVYFYSRDSLSFLQMTVCTNKGIGISPVVKVAFSPVEPDLFAVARQDQLVMLFHGNFDKLTKKALWLCTIHTHAKVGAQVTSMVWSPNGRWLFTGDNKGNVARTYIWPEMAGGTPNDDIQTWIILEKEAPVVQMQASIRHASALSTSLPEPKEAKHSEENDTVGTDNNGNDPRNANEENGISAKRKWSAQLLVSTRRRAVLIDVSDPNFVRKEHVVQVGSKPHKKEGPFGACMHPTNPAMMLASRKSKRMWEAEISSGSVVKTLKLKLDQQAFEFRPFSIPFPLDTKKYKPEWLKENIQLCLLTPFMNKVISWGYGPSIVLVDPKTASIPAWHLDCGKAIDLAVPHSPIFPSEGDAHQLSPSTKGNSVPEFFLLRSMPGGADVVRIRSLKPVEAISTLLYERHTHGIASKDQSSFSSLRSCVALAVHHNLSEKPILNAIRVALKSAIGAGDEVQFPSELKRRFDEIVKDVPEDVPIPVLRNYTVDRKRQDIESENETQQEHHQGRIGRDGHKGASYRRKGAKNDRLHFSGSFSSGLASKTNSNTNAMQATSSVFERATTWSMATSPERDALRKLTRKSSTSGATNDSHASQSPVSLSGYSFDKITRAASSADIASAFVSTNMTFPQAELGENAQQGLHRAPMRRHKTHQLHSENTNSFSASIPPRKPRKKRIRKWEKLELIPGDSLKTSSSNERDVSTTVGNNRTSGSNGSIKDAKPRRRAGIPAFSFRAHRHRKKRPSRPFGPSLLRLGEKTLNGEKQNEAGGKMNDSLGVADPGDQKSTSEDQSRQPPCEGKNNKQPEDGFKNNLSNDSSFDSKLHAEIKEETPKVSSALQDVVERIHKTHMNLMEMQRDHELKKGFIRRKRRVVLSEHAICSKGAHMLGTRYGFVAKAAPILQRWLMDFKLFVLGEWGGDMSFEKNEGLKKALMTFSPEGYQKAGELVLLHIDCRCTIRSTGRGQSQSSSIQTEVLKLVRQLIWIIPLRRLVRVCGAHKLDMVLRNLASLYPALCKKDVELKNIFSKRKLSIPEQKQAVSLLKTPSDEFYLLLNANCRDAVKRLRGDVIQIMAEAFPYFDPWLACRAIQEPMQDFSNSSKKGDVKRSEMERKDKANRRMRKNNTAQLLIEKYYSELMRKHPRCRKDRQLVTEWCLSALHLEVPPAPARLFHSAPLPRLPGGGRPQPPLPLPPSGSLFPGADDFESGEAALKFGLMREDPAGGLLFRMMRGWRPRCASILGGKFAETTEESIRSPKIPKMNNMWSSRTLVVVRSVLLQPTVFRVNEKILGKEFLKLGYFEGIILLCLRTAFAQDEETQSHATSPLAASAVFLAASLRDFQALRTLLYRAVRKDRRLWTYTLRLLYALGTPKKQAVKMATKSKSNLKKPLDYSVVESFTLSNAVLDLARLQGANVAMEILRDSLGSSPEIDEALVSGTPGTEEKNSRRASTFYRRLLEIEWLRRKQLRVAKELKAEMEQIDQGEFVNLFKL